MTSRGTSQKPPKHSRVQQSALLVHEPATAVQTGAPPSPVVTASQLPFVQLPEQQSAPVVHFPAEGEHFVEHVFVPGSQKPEQQSASLAHVALVALHAVGGSMQRFGSCVLSHRSLSGVARQHPCCGPVLQLSPVGRHLEFTSSIAHVLSAPQIPEQHSALPLQAPLFRTQILFAQTPPKQPSEQQSCARAHGTPLALHASVHLMTPAFPVTGSHRPLQHDALAVQSASGTRHAPAAVPPSPVAGGATHLPPLHVPAQQSKPLAHVAPGP